MDGQTGPPGRVAKGPETAAGIEENLKTLNKKGIRRLVFWLSAAVAVWVAAGAFTPAVAHAHGAIDAGQNPLTVWNTNPLPALLLLLAAYLYVTGLSRWHRPSHPINQWQKASFFAGLLVFFLALQSPIEPLAAHMFSVHQLQHVMLRMLGPVLILLGAPLTPMLRGLPAWALLGFVRPIVGNPGVRRVYDFVTNPVLTTILFLGVLYLWQIPGPHDLALSHELVHQFMHTTMLSSGFLFWWLVIDPKPHRSRLHYGLRVLYLGLIVIPNTVLGAAITFQSGIIYAGYERVTQPYALSLIFDQQLGGLILWVIGDMMSILVAGIVMIMWYEKEEGAAERLRAASG